MKDLKYLLNESLLKLTPQEIVNDDRYNMTRLLLFLLITSNDDPEIDKTLKILNDQDFNYMKNVLAHYGIDIDNIPLENITDWNAYINDLAHTDIDEKIYKELS